MNRRVLTPNFLVDQLDSNTSWIQRSFKKRDCVRFVPSKSAPDAGRCCCGRYLAEHDDTVQIEANSRNFLTVTKDERWSVQRHTRCEPTDAFGVIEFDGMAHPTKAQVGRGQLSSDVNVVLHFQYLRLSYDTRPDLVLKLFLRVWNLKLPRLVISIDGGIANFELQPKLKRVLKKGLFRAAKTTGAWIITNGCHQGRTSAATLIGRAPRTFV